MHASLLACDWWFPTGVGRSQVEPSEGAAPEGCTVDLRPLMSGYELNGRLYALHPKLVEEDTHGCAWVRLCPSCFDAKRSGDEANQRAERFCAEAPAFLNADLALIATLDVEGIAAFCKAAQALMGSSDADAPLETAANVMLVDVANVAAAAHALLHVLVNAAMDERGADDAIATGDDALQRLIAEHQRRIVVATEQVGSRGYVALHAADDPWPG